MRVPRFLAVLPAAVLLTVAVGSCRVDNSPTGVAAPAATPSADLISGVVGSTTSLVGTLLQCTPMPYAQNSKVIGPAGGDLQIGPHVLHVPAGALSQSVLITGQAPSDDVNSVRLYPQGLQFATGKPATLTMTYANCNLLGKILPKRIAYTTDNLQILSYLLSLDNLLSKQVTGQIQHFSRYAVAW
ncbi:MAG TPA: hypothetical protein VIW26_16960 [Gemmatimonadales bacterium]|jgi:hypothetical protein